MSIVGFFRKITRNKLADRIVAIVLTTFLPLNLVAIMIAGIVVNKATEQIMDSYQRDLDFYMERFDEHLAVINLGINTILTEYQMELTLSNTSDAVNSMEMLQTMQKALDESELTGFYFLYDKISDRFMFKYSENRYSYREAEEIRQYVYDNKNVTNLWVVKMVNGHLLTFRSGEYTNYNLGFMIDADIVAKELLFEVLDDMELYVSAGNDDYVKYVSGEKMGELVDRLPESKNSFDISWNSDTSGLFAMMRIPGRSLVGAIPVFYWSLFFSTVLSLFLLYAIWKFMNIRVVRPIGILEQSMKEFEIQNLDYRITESAENETEEFQYLYDTFNRMADEIQKSYDKDIKMVRAELDNLKLQVNPHMLLNSFNMIYSLAQTQNYQCIQEFSLHLVEYFRYALKESSSFVTLQKEMAFVESYVGIQKIRFPGSFTSVHKIDDDVKEALVPPLLIQNFVENSMKYALVPGKVIEVLINVRKQEDHLAVSITDTGSGIKEEVLEDILKGDIYTDKLGRKHIGIWNCRRRLEAFYGGEARLSIISNRGEGTQVFMELPFLTDVSLTEKKNETVSR